MPLSCLDVISQSPQAPSAVRHGAEMGAGLGHLWRPHGGQRVKGQELRSPEQEALASPRVGPLQMRTHSNR